MLETKLVYDDFTNRRVKVEIIDTEAAEWEARLACALIERWGLVAAMPDGEDAAGRAKLRKLAPAELVMEACETAQLAVAEFRKRGWVVKLPGLADLEAFRQQDREAEKD
jgi:hypothetical protein